MEENDKIMEDLEKPWEQKLAESKEQSQAQADSSIADQDTMEESKDMGSAASNSRVETSQDAETGADIFNQTSPSQPEANATAEEEKKDDDEDLVSLNPAAQLAMRKARRSTLTQNDKSVPYITNLNEDPQMSGIVYYPCTKGEILIGRKTATPQPDIILGAIGIQKNHGKIKLK